MAILFRTMKLKEPSFTQKLLGKQPKENAFIKINNLMAHQKSITDLPSEHVYRIIEEYDIQVRKPESREQILKMYAQLLRDAFLQRNLNELRISELLYFKRLFLLSDKELKSVHRKVIAQVFKQDINRIMSRPNGLSAAQRNFLSKLQERIILPEAIASNIRKENPYTFFLQLAQGKGKDKPLHQKQHLEVKALCQSIGIPLPESPTLEHLNQYRLYWCIDNNHLPRLPQAPTALKKDPPRIALPVQWFERKQRIRYTHYGECSLKIKILQGTYWREPLSGSKELAKEVWEKKDKGDLYLSAQRLFFVGEHGNKQLPLNKVSDFLAYTNGLSVQRHNGEETFLFFADYVPLMSMLLGRLHSEL